MDTEASYRNLIDRADYSNLADSTVYFSYEDHFARMIVPLRHAINDLAAAFLLEGNEHMASRVLKEGCEKLYPDHLPPSYTNLQAAELLLTLHEGPAAIGLCKAVFEFFSLRVKEDENAGRKPSDLDRYLVQRAGELLVIAGDESESKALGNEP